MTEPSAPRFLVNRFGCVGRIRRLGQGLALAPLWGFHSGEAGGSEPLLLIGKALSGKDELVAQLVVNDCGFSSRGRVSVAPDAQSFERGVDVRRHGAYPEPRPACGGFPERLVARVRLPRGSGPGPPLRNFTIECSHAFAQRL
jgi:hypothetical protein